MDFRAVFRATRSAQPFSRRPSRHFHQGWQGNPETWADRPSSATPSRHNAHERPARRGGPARSRRTRRPSRMMIGHQMAAAVGAIFALAHWREGEGGNALGTAGDGHRLRLPEREGVDRPTRPGAAGGAVAIAMPSGSPATSSVTAPQKHRPLWILPESAMTGPSLMRKASIA